MLKTALNAFTAIKSKFSITKVTKEENKLLTKLLDSNIIKYDVSTNTIILDIPSNLIINTQGSQLHIAQDGQIVQVADNIHLNPPITKRTKINIVNSGRSYDEVISPLSKLIEDKDGSNQL